MNTQLLASQADDNVAEAHSLFDSGQGESSPDNIAALAHWTVALYLHHVCGCRPPGNPPPGAAGWPTTWEEVQA